MPMFLSAFVVGIMNPAAILTFLFAFSYFNLAAGMTILHGTLLVLGTLAGTFLWWLSLSFAASRFREKAVRHQSALSRIFGCLLFIFGMAIWIRALIGLVACSPQSPMDGQASETIKEEGAEGMQSANNPQEKENVDQDQFYITAGETVFTAVFSDNSSAGAFKDLLSEGPLTVDMHDYGSFEKVGEIGRALPRNDEQITTEPGDVILYLGTSITIYYDTNSWNFTRLGKIQDATKEDLLAALGAGDVTVTFSLEKSE